MATGVSTFSLVVANPLVTDMLFLICEEVETCCFTAELGIIVASITRKESHSLRARYATVLS